jgi:hypothetical protein
MLQILQGIKCRTEKQFLQLAVSLHFVSCSKQLKTLNINNVQKLENSLPTFELYGGVWTPRTPMVTAQAQDLRHNSFLFFHNSNTTRANLVKIVTIMSQQDSTRPGILYTLIIKTLATAYSSSY